MNIFNLILQTVSSILNLTVILVMAAFLGPSIPGCEVEKIAAGQTRRG